MRYGLVRDITSMPAAAVQRGLLEAATCDLIVVEGEPAPSTQRRLTKLFLGLKAGDEVVVQSLDAFQRTTGELAQMIRHFLDVGVNLRIVGGEEEPDTLPLQDNARRILGLLADHESRRPRQPSSGAASRANSGSRKPLSKYQIEYARKLHREGSSLRAIGLLFQVSPAEVWEAING